MTVTVSKFPFVANGRALSLNSTDGFLQLVTRKEDGLLVGAQVAGAGASDIISEIGLAIEAGMTAEDIAQTIHAHPTLGEITMEAESCSWNANSHCKIIYNVNSPSLTIREGLFLFSSNDLQGL